MVYKLALLTYSQLATIVFIYFRVFPFRIFRLLLVLTF
jgi:hypothetical protein